MPPHLARFAGCLLRGVGQVMLQGDARAGALFVIAVGLHAPGLGLALVWGVLVGTLAGRFLGADDGQLHAGLYGFNGALVGVALGLFLQPGLVTIACIGLAAALSSVMMAAFTAVMRVWALPALTAPFVLTSLGFLAATPGLRGLRPAPASAPEVVADAGIATLPVLAEGLLTGIGQVFFQPSMLSGGVMLLGLLVASPRAAVAALAGSASGLLVAAILGAGVADLRAGLYGFNSVLVAIVLAPAVAGMGRAGVVLTVLAAVAAPVVTAAVNALLAPLGLPGLTLPFVLVAWAFLAALRQLPGPRPAAPAA